MKTMYRSRAAVAALMLSIQHLSFAAQPDTVIVTATRTAQTVDQALAAVTVITREEIEASQAQDVAELLRFEAGLDIGRNGGTGQSTSVFLRGTDSNHTLVLVDGVRINPGTIGGAAWQHLDPALIERVEIVRGPRSSLYGSDAIGGVIQIFTRRGTSGTQARVMAGGGSDRMREGAVGIQHSSNGFRFGADLSHSQTEGFPTRTDATENRGYRNNGINTYAGLAFGRADVEMSHWQAGGNVEYVDFFLTPQDQDFFNSVTAATLKAPLGGNWTTTLKLSRMHDDIDQNEIADFAHTRRNVLDWQNDVQIGRANLLTVGVQLSREHTRALSFGELFGEDTDTGAVFAQNQWQGNGHRLLAATRHIDHDTFGRHTTGELAYGLDLGTEAHLYASIATGFRAPDSTDRFGFGGNPDLDPEISRNTELGLRFRLSPTQKTSAGVFRNDIRDLILFVDPDGWMGPLPGQNENVERARIQGVEIDYEYAAKPWSFDVTGIAQNPENRDTGEQLARRAKRSATFGLRYDTNLWSTGAQLLVTGKRPDSDFSTTVNAGYSLLNLTGEYRFSPALSLRARVENALDREYVLADGYNVQGRALFMQLAYRYGSE